jgi:predicted 3-demethylubiquinone-9 3-methyltransferase (glyoxalase superfamily)
VPISEPIICLWYDDDAVEAANFYVSLLPNSKITNTTYYRDHPIKPKGSVLTVEFELNQRPFLALNGGPFFKHSEAASIQVQCDTQEEIDQLWDAITNNGGEESECGWCKDRFGVSWQITPRVLARKIYNADNSVADKAWAAMMSMRKIIIADL